MEHTELPWKVTQYKQKSLICIDSTIPDANDITHQICGLEKGKAASGFLEIEIHLANAEYIVRTCNAFPAMKALVEQYVVVLEEGHPQPINKNCDCVVCRVRVKAKAALAAGGE